MKRIITMFLLLIVASGLFMISLPVSAEGNIPQVYYETPTARPDGRIIYIVQKGDSCTRIALLNGIDEEELRRLNDLKGDCVVMLGQELLIGVMKSTAVPGNTPTPTSILPLGTPLGGKGEICVFLFDDINGNGMAEENEPSIAGGEISITDQLGKVSLTGTTTDSVDPLCYPDIPTGEYLVSIAAPQKYNPTTLLNYSLTLIAGDKTYVDFGAQISSVAQPTPATAQEGGARSPILGVLGGLFVLAGIGLAIYFRQIRHQ